MIVTTMKNAEISAEIRRDARYVEAMIRRFMNCKLRRLIAGERPLQSNYWLEFTTPRNNHVLAQLRFENKKKAYQQMGGYCVFYVINTGHGKYVFTLNMFNEKGNMLLNIYQPHFFQRYAQRCGVKATEIKLIKTFFNRNRIHGINDGTQKWKDADDVNVMFTTNEGYLMGHEEPDGTVHMNTMVTHEQMTQKQKRGALDIIRKFTDNFKSMRKWRKSRI